MIRDAAAAIAPLGPYPRENPGAIATSDDRLYFLLLNVGHYLDHLFTLVFATVAALALSREWGLSYSELVPYATPGFIAFGLFALPAGWLADTWSRDGMMAIFFVGIGLAAIATSFATNPVEIGLGLFVVGVFAAIYHPVGLAIVTARWRDTGSRIAMNGVWGNLGVASAALLTGIMIDHGGWRAAFILPGLVSIAIGALYTWLRWSTIRHPAAAKRALAATSHTPSAAERSALARTSAIVFITAALASIIFQSTTFALPKMFDERLQELAASLAAVIPTAAAAASTGSIIGGLAFLVFAIASLAQLIVGHLLDRHGARTIFMSVAAIQIVFFILMRGATGWPALLIALGFMLGAFGQIPINDFLIGKLASGPYRARAYAVRFLVSFTALAATLPLIAVVHHNWGFDTLFLILAVTATAVLAAAALLPRAMPVPAE